MSYQDDLKKELTMARKQLHIRKMQQARMGINCDPSIIMAIEDFEKDIRTLEAKLNIPQIVVPPAPRIEERRPTPEPVYRDRIAARQTGARQADIDHQMNLLKIHRANLSHYRAQAKAFGGVELAMPVTRHGMNEARAGIDECKRNLEQLGVIIDNLPGDE